MGNDPAIRMQQLRDTGLDIRGSLMSLPHREMIIEYQMKLDPVGDSRVAVAEIVIG